jgi:protein gp37
MSENSKIEWCDHTFNPWVGCTKVSPACDHCYAETWAKRTGQAELWQGERRRTSEQNWRQPLKRNREYEKFFAEHGRRQRVFCASLADVFDNQVPDKWRHDLFDLIAQTPNLDWLLLTKRPQNISKMTPTLWNIWKNVWLGVTVENQTEADRRIPLLLQTPAVVRFLSCEPLLGPIDLERHLNGGKTIAEWKARALSGADPYGFRPTYPRIHQIIVGGESGTGARPMHPTWARSLRDQTKAAGAAFFFKQWGEWAPFRPSTEGYAAPDGPTLPDGAAMKHRLTWGYEFEHTEFPKWMAAVRVGKKAAGRLLDGRTWNEFPDEQR